MKNKTNNIIEVDKESDRIVAYVVNQPREALDELNELGENERPSKIFVYLKKQHCDFFTEANYNVEGTMSCFFDGEDAVLVSKFLSTDRSRSNSIEKNNETLELVNRDTKSFEDLIKPADVKIERLSEDDLVGLTDLYKRVFDQYPTNIFDVDYLKEVIAAKKYIFVVAKMEGKVVAAASAMLTPYGGAEITDCATDPSYRGKQLLASIINELEKVLISQGVYMFYSITRAISVGMNMTVKRLGYKFEGTLIKNCVISSGLEDMNVWTKSVIK